MYPKALLTLGDHIRKRRLDLGLRQKDVALTLGADVQTVLNWEKNRRSSCLPYLPKIIVFLGYVPPPFNKKASHIVERMKAYRLTHGISQDELANLLGVDATTVNAWETGRHKPSPKTSRKLVRFLESYMVKMTSFLLGSP